MQVKVIEEIRIPRSDGGTMFCTIRRLTPQHLTAVIDLQQQELQSMATKDVFLGRPHDILAACLDDEGVTVGVFADDRLVAFRMLYYPGRFNQGEFAGLPVGEWDKVAHLEVAVVHPLYRGYGLMRRMASPLLDEADDLRGKRYLCSVVSPQNYPSIKDKLVLGVPVIRLIELAGGHWRYIFCQDRLKPAQFDEAAAIAVSVNDRERQFLLLEQGYQGFQIEKLRHDTVLWYGVPQRD